MSNWVHIDALCGPAELHLRCGFEDGVPSRRQVRGPHQHDSKCWRGLRVHSPPKLLLFLAAAWYAKFSMVNESMRTSRGWGDHESCAGDGNCSNVHVGYANVVLRLIFSVAAVVWSLRSSLGFLSEVVKPERRALAAYPVCLFFTAIGWMVMLRTSSS
jgi:hypothetical protein